MAAACGELCCVRLRRDTTCLKSLLAFSFWAQVCDGGSHRGIAMHGSNPSDINAPCNAGLHGRQVHHRDSSPVSLYCETREVFGDLLLPLRYLHQPGRQQLPGTRHGHLSSLMDCLVTQTRRSAVTPEHANSTPPAIHPSEVPSLSQPCAMTLCP